MRRPGEKIPAAQRRSETVDLLIEIGTEEMPASYIAPALEQLRRAVSSWAPPHKIVVWGTPRRLVVAVRQLERFRTVAIWGPPMDRAHDEKGRWNAAAAGFARSRGMETSALEVDIKKGKKYLKLSLREELGKEISATLPGLIESIEFPKSMRWLPGDRFRFARPIRWLVCLLGRELLELKAAGVKAGRETRGHRFFSPGPWKLPCANLRQFERLLRQKYVLVDPARRRRAIAAAISRHQKKFLAGSVLSEVEQELLDEITFLVEYSRVVMGAFDPRFLHLPAEAIVTVMKSHQRYFPLWDSSGQLLPKFLIVANGPFSHSLPIRRGNERVLEARLSDAEFFWKEDLAHSLEERRLRLSGIVFHRQLGDYLGKVKRLERLAPAVGRLMGFDAEELKRAGRAAFLSKSDLTTAMVTEFTELQGVMGREYARRGGEEADVAQALYEQYLPRGTGDELPRTPAGLALSIADKLDTLSAFLGTGLKPSGSLDPYGLRRHALGVVKIALGRSLTLPLSPLIDECLSAIDINRDRSQLRDEILGFILVRLKAQLESQGLKTHVIQAVFAAAGDDLLDLAQRARLVQEMELTDLLRAATTIVERTKNIFRDIPSAPSAELREDLFKEAEEKELLSAYRSAAGPFQELVSSRSYRRAIELYARSFSGPLHAFFERVMVNVEDQSLRRNRLVLLGMINRLFAERIADLSLLQFGRGEYLL